jgi:hypothetical protein
MSEYKAFIANCLIQGELPTEVEAGRVWNLIKIKLDGFDLQLIEHPEFITQPHSQFDGQTLHTTDLVITDLKPVDFDRAQTLSHEVAWLLSFATVSEVGNFGYYYSEVDPVATTQSMTGRVYVGLPVINTLLGSTVREFLKQTWPTFHALRTVRQLDIVFDYFVFSQLSRQPIELQLLISFVLLENLKSTFAHERGYPFERGRFRPTPGARTEKTFAELLKEMLQAVGMTPDLSKIIELRNKIIHSGITQLPVPERVEIFFFTQDIIREYLVRLLNYQEAYSLYQQRVAFHQI